MEANQAQPRPGHQCGQPLHELQRAHHQVRRAIAPRRLELQLHLTGGVDLHPLVGQRRPGDVAAQLFQPLAVVRFDPDCGVQTEPVDVGTQRLARFGLARHRPSQGQHLLPGAGTKCDAVSDGRGLQRPQGVRLLAFGMRLGQVGLSSDSTHCRTGTCGRTWSTRCAAVCAMRRAPHDGQNPRRLQLKASSLS